MAGFKNFGCPCHFCRLKFISYSFPYWSWEPYVLKSGFFYSLCDDSLSTNIFLSMSSAILPNKGKHFWNLILISLFRAILLMFQVGWWMFKSVSSFLLELFYVIDSHVRYVPLFSCFSLLDLVNYWGPFNLSCQLFDGGMYLHLFLALPWVLVFFFLNFDLCTSIADLHVQSLINMHVYEIDAFTHIQDFLSRYIMLMCIF